MWLRLSRYLTIAALTLTVLLCAWQLRSYWVRDFINGGNTAAYITSESGRIVVVIFSIPRGPLEWGVREVEQPSLYVDREFGRLTTGIFTGGYGGHGWALGRVAYSVSGGGNGFIPRAALIVPHALLGLLIAAPPAMAWRVLRRRERALREQTDRCLACGYDLRGIASERCPECGTTVDTREAKATDEVGPTVAQAPSARPKGAAAGGPPVIQRSDSDEGPRALVAMSEATWRPRSFGR